jgi:hypothetical protein
VARGDPLQGVGDEVPRPPAGIGLGILLNLPHHARHLMTYELLRALEELALGIRGGKARDALELCHLGILRGLQIFLKLLQVRLSICDSLLASLVLGQLAVDRLFLREYALLDLDHFGSSVLQLVLDLGTEA